MDTPMSPAVSGVDMNVPEESSRVAEQAPKMAKDIERLSASIVRLTSTSIEGLEGLTSELQELQKFLNTEVERVQGEIDSALAGIKIIVETIAPFKTSAMSQTTPITSRAIRSGIATWPKA